VQRTYDRLFALGKGEIAASTNVRALDMVRAGLGNLDRTIGGVSA